MFGDRRAILFTAAIGSLLALNGCPSQEQTPSSPTAANSSSSLNSSKSTPVQLPPDDPTEATIDGSVIRRSELVKPLIDAFGLNMLLKLVELDLAQQQVQRMGLSVTPADVATETQRYLDEVFKDDKRLAEMRDQMDQKSHDGKPVEVEQLRQAIGKEQQRLLQQLLDNKKLTRTEFDLAMQTNTYLRAIVQPAVEAKLTPDNLQESFRVRYGEKVQVRHIALGNMQEVVEAKRRLAAGESFQQVAQLMSRNRQSASLGGELQAFSRMSAGIPQNFKDAAFDLKNPGDISEVVQAEGSYHLIQLMDHIPPTAVKFEDVRDSVRQDLAETLMQASVKDLRSQLGQLALKDLQIVDPVLAAQFHAKVTQQNDEVRGRDAVRSELRSERQATSNAAAATEPARSAAAPPATTAPATRP